MISHADCLIRVARRKCWNTVSQSRAATSSLIAALTWVFRLSHFCARLRYVAGGSLLPVLPGCADRYQPHNGQSDDSQSSSDWSDRQTG